MALPCDSLARPLALAFALPGMRVWGYSARVGFVQEDQTTATLTDFNSVIDLVYPVTDSLVQEPGIAMRATLEL